MSSELIPSTLLPHKPPMLLLDEVLAVNAERVDARVTLREHSTFVSEGRVRACLALEYMAQCIGAYAGFHNRSLGRTPQIGYLIAAREILLHQDYFYVGDTLEISATRVWGDSNLGQFECCVERQGTQVAKAAISVYQPSDQNPHESSQL